ncbi:putative Zn peptidase [Clostridioides difficile]|nr:putative Zn peptidase [Clostridioides difficile]
MKLTKKDLRLPEEELRLKIKELADEVRYKFVQKGIIDIFDVLENEVFLIRNSFDSEEFSGFSTYYEDTFIVVLNSSFTLGHERYSGAHELYHVTQNKDILKREKLIDEQKHKEEDKKAEIFAAEFLMPESYVKELFYKLVDETPDKIEPRHVIRLNNKLKVSYRAMLKRLIQFDLCDINRYKELSDFGNLQNKLKLQELTKIEGYDLSLITPSKVCFVSNEYIEALRRNYENNKISYTKISELLRFIGKYPLDYGYKFIEEEDDLV